jgi:hypothetical protein
MAALASSHRQAGELAEAAELYGQLYAINEQHSGTANQSSVRNRVCAYVRLCLCSWLCG